MPWSQPKVYELYGPRLDNIHYVFEGTPENSLLALDVGDIDIIEWPPFSTCKCSRAYSIFAFSREISIQQLLRQMRVSRLSSTLARFLLEAPLRLLSL